MPRLNHNYKHKAIFWCFLWWYICMKQDIKLWNTFFIHSMKTQWNVQKEHTLLFQTSFQSSYQTRIRILYVYNKKKKLKVPFVLFLLVKLSSFIKIIQICYFLILCLLQVYCSVFCNMTALLFSFNKFIFREVEQLQKSLFCLLQITWKMFW